MDTVSQAQPIERPGVLANLYANPSTARTQATLSSAFQSTLVPSLAYEDAHFEVYGQTFPKEEVGGDLVDLVAAGNDVIAYVADASGHGLSAAVLVGMVKTAVRYGLNLGQDLSEILAGLNHVLPTVKEPDMFATFAGLRFDWSDEVEFTTAGHVPLLQYRSSQSEIIRHSIPQFPLGLFDDPGYVCGRARYEAGDVFLLVTDGIVEASDRQETQFGFARLEQILRELEGRPLPEIFDAALEAVTQHGAQHDDQTMLLVRALSIGRPELTRLM